MTRSIRRTFNPSEIAAALVEERDGDTLSSRRVEVNARVGYWRVRLERYYGGDDPLAVEITGPGISSEKAVGESCFLLLETEDGLWTITPVEHNISAFDALAAIGEALIVAATKMAALEPVDDERAPQQPKPGRLRVG